MSYKDACTFRALARVYFWITRYLGKESLIHFGENFFVSPNPTKMQNDYCGGVCSWCNFWATYSKVTLVRRWFLTILLAGHNGDVYWSVLCTVLKFGLIFYFQKITPCFYKNPGFYSNPGLITINCCQKVRNELSSFVCT